MSAGSERAPGETRSYLIAGAGGPMTGVEGPPTGEGPAFSDRLCTPADRRMPACPAEEKDPLGLYQDEVSRKSAAGKCLRPRQGLRWSPLLWSTVKASRPRRLSRARTPPRHASDTRGRLPSIARATSQQAVNGVSLSYGAPDERRERRNVENEFYARENFDCSRSLLRQAPDGRLVKQTEKGPSLLIWRIANTCYMR